MMFIINGLRNSKSLLPRLYAIQQYRATRLIAVLLAVAMMNLTQGCYYFKVNTRQQPSSELVAGLDQQGKNFILHFNGKTYRRNLGS
jgi:hypothetical protein